MKIPAVIPALLVTTALGAAFAAPAAPAFAGVKWTPKGGVTEAGRTWSGPAPTLLADSPAPVKKAKSLTD